MKEAQNFRKVVLPYCGVCDFMSLQMCSHCWCVRVFFILCDCLWLAPRESCHILPLSVDRRIAINFDPSSPDENFLASAKANRLPLGVKVSRGIL